DYQMALRHNLPLTVVIGPNGSMNAAAGAAFAGLDRMEARKAVVEKLESQGLMVKIEDYVHRVGYSQRSNVPIEPYLSEQWFLRYPSVAQSAKAVEREEIKFHPERWARTYAHWMVNIRDWCISRQLWWGHRVPVWYNQSAGPIPPGTTDAGLVRCQIESPGEGWVQDTDVLDTWFSSWLWPFATLGWPEKTAELTKFYPTTDLVTGPDIIFFWVARMIMAGYEFVGEKPFKNVYFTGLIRDKQGRKMSKSLGNSPDPLDLIAKFGADALRFGVMRSAPLGQDVLYDEQQVELGRNFCNKLWNACRFRQMQAGEVEGEINPVLLTSDDKWILLKLDQAIAELSEALAQYRFNEGAQILYRFFWSEYCDWYLEGSKAAMTGGDLAVKTNTLAVIDFVLSNMLRLFHPFMPFITEELWHGMGYNQELPEGQGGSTIMYAHWPKPFDEDFRAHYRLDAESLKFVEGRNQLITQGRNLRQFGNIPASRKVTFVLTPARDLPPHDLAAMQHLLNAEALTVTPGYQAPKGTPSARSDLGELYLPLAGLIDVAAEKLRVGKELAKVESEIEKAEQKLGNPSFVQKAPAAVLEERRQRLLDFQTRRVQLQNAIDAL
ncbi:MAG TPA: class I tRNA ligase family protein, partial [Candidatus Saccharimonadales bacterium]|nr:class I tRNA ligase family protein [Candidatus Saccharimonadales bacterium]